MLDNFEQILGRSISWSMKGLSCKILWPSKGLFRRKSSWHLEQSVNHVPSMGVVKYGRRDYIGWSVHVGW